MIDSERNWSYGMSGPNDFPVIENKASVPLEFLDPGIALLVKVLPLIGINSIYSCNGHLKQNPVLWFKTLEDVYWMEHVLNSLLTREEVKKKFVIVKEPGWMGQQLQFVTIPEDIGSYFEAYFLSIDIGQELLNPKTRKVLNYFKNTTI